MRTRIGLLFSSLALVVIAAAIADAAFEVTIDTNGGGSTTFSDADTDGVVDVNETIGGVLEARGRFKQVLETINSRLAIAPLPPFSEALFRNVSATSQTITVAIKSAALAVPVKAPLGWDLFYHASVDDPVDAVIEVPSHSVEGFAVGGTTPLGVLTETPLTAAGNVAVEDHGVAPDTETSDAWLIWQFTLGPNDEFRVPSDGDFDGDSIQLNIYSHSQKCTDHMNNGARKVTFVAQKMDTKCVKSSTGLVTTCVDAPGDIKTVKKQRSVVTDFQVMCDPVPAWGVNDLACCFGGGTNDGSICTDSSTCGGGECAPGACIAEIAENGINEMTHDIYGPEVSVASDTVTHRCQRAVSKRSGKLFVEYWKAFRACKRDEFAAITNDSDLRASCLEPQPDPKEKLLKRADQVSEDIQAKCLDKGVTTLGIEFPGACALEPDPTFGDCIVTRVRCRFCRAANYADAIVDPIDCDIFDDDVSNASCPE